MKLFIKNFPDVQNYPWRVYFTKNGRTAHICWITKTYPEARAVLENMRTTWPSREISGRRMYYTEHIRHTINILK